jgi:hypothetical protein
MANPYDAKLIPLGLFLKGELPEFSVNRDPDWKIDTGGTFRLDKDKTPEHLIKIDSDVLDDHSSDEIARQFREQNLAVRLKHSLKKQKVWVKPVRGGGIRLHFEDWQP